MHDVLKRQYSPGWEQAACSESTFSLYFSQSNSKNSTCPGSQPAVSSHKKPAPAFPDLRKDCQTKPKVVSLCLSKDFVKFYRQHQHTRHLTRLPSFRNNRGKSAWFSFQAGGSFSFLVE